MLSATGRAPPARLVDLAYTALGERTEVPFAQPTGRSKSKWTTPLSAFLNNCVNACRAALDKRTGYTKKDPSLYSHLRFVICGRSMMSVEPSLVGGLGLVSGDRVAWSPESILEKQALIPVEVRADWHTLVAQAETYAHCLFSASHARQFVVVLGFQHTDAQLRFLVFHRSGLTGSKPCSVWSPEGQKDTLRIFLSILSWTSANDAGFPKFINDSDMSLLCHEGDKTGVVGRIAEVLYSDPCVQGRGSGVLLVEYPTGKGQTCRHLRTTRTLFYPYAYRSSDM